MNCTVNLGKYEPYNSEYGYFSRRASYVQFFRVSRKSLMQNFIFFSVFLYLLHMHFNLIWLNCNRIFNNLKSFRSLFSLIRTEYEDLLRKSPYSVQMRENRDHKSSEYRHFLRSDRFLSCGSYAAQKWSFPLRISSVNVSKSIGNCGFGHIYWRNP